MSSLYAAKSPRKHVGLYCIPLNAKSLIVIFTNVLACVAEYKNTIITCLTGDLSGSAYSCSADTAYVTKLHKHAYILVVFVQCYNTVDILCPISGRVLMMMIMMTMMMKNLTIDTSNQLLFVPLRSVIV